MADSQKRRRGGSEAIIRALFDPGDGLDSFWSDADLISIMKYLLGSRVQTLAATAAASASPAVHAPSVTIADLLMRADATASDLRMVKDWAKRQCEISGTRDVPESVARAVYAATAIHAAANGHRITRLETRQMRRLGAWCLAQRWIPDGLAQAVRRDLAALPVS